MSWAVLAAVEVGSLVGAGFASGREVWEFFARYGPEGQVGVILFVALIAFAGGLILEVARSHESHSYRDLTTALTGPVLSRWLDIPVAISLYLGLSATLAGAGELGVNLGLPSPMIGVAGAALLTGGIVARQNGMEAASMVLVPLLVMLILATTGLHVLPTLKATNGTFARMWTGGAAQGAAKYFLYNALLCLVLFASLGARVQSRMGAWLGALAGAAVLGALALAVVHAEVRTSAAVSGAALPLLVLARGRHSLLGHGYALALAAALLTTSVGNAFGLSARLQAGGWRADRSGLWVSLLAVPLALVGFVPLVRYGYQVVALCGALYLGVLGCGAVFTLWTGKPAGNRKTSA